MRGADAMQESLVTVAKLDDFVPEDHPLRGVRLRSRGARADPPREAPMSDIAEMPYSVATSDGPVTARAGLVVLPDFTFRSCPESDIVAVPGGVVDAVLRDDAVIAWVGETARRASIAASVRTGAFLLAKAGLLDGRSATTHREDFADLRAAFPGVAVRKGVRWVDEGPVVSSAKIAAGIDMSLHRVARVAGPGTGAGHRTAPAHPLVRKRERPAPRGGGTTMKKTEPQTSRSPSQLIDARIEELGDWRGRLLGRLRALVRKADPDVVEEWKWRGVPVWSHDGLICTGETYKSTVKMTFAKGAALKDPAGLFNASLDGTTRRAIDFREGAAIDEEALKALVRAAVTLNKSKAKR